MGAVAVIWNIWSVLSPFLPPDFFAALTPRFRFPFSWLSKRERRALCPQVLGLKRDTSVHALTMKTCPLHLALPLPPPPISHPGSLRRLRDFVPNDGTKIKWKKNWKTSCFISLLTLYNVVNACFNSPLPLLFCVHRSAVALDRGGRAAEDWRKTLPWPNFLFLFNLKVFYIKWYCDFLKKMTQLTVVVLLLHALCSSQ